MSLLHALDAVFIRLSTIPGLGFLHDYVHELETQKMRREGILGTYKGYVNSVRDAGAEAKKAVGGHGDHADDSGDSGRGGHRGHAAEADDSRRGKEDDVDDELDQDYEDDDFESYLQ